MIMRVVFFPGCVLLYSVFKGFSTCFDALGRYHGHIHFLDLECAKGSVRLVTGSFWSIWSAELAKVIADQIRILRKGRAVRDLFRLRLIDRQLPLCIWTWNPGRFSVFVQFDRVHH